MRSFNSAKGWFLKFSYLAVLSLLIFGLIVPLPSHALLSGPFGEVQLSMHQIGMYSTGTHTRFPEVYVAGSVSI